MLKHRTVIRRLWRQAPSLPPGDIVFSWVRPDGTPQAIFTPEFDLYLCDDGSANLQLHPATPGGQIESILLTPEQVKTDPRVRKYL